MQVTYMAWELQIREASLLGEKQGKKVQNQWGESPAHYIEFNQVLWPSPTSRHVNKYLLHFCSVFSTVLSVQQKAMEKPHQESGGTESLHSNKGKSDNSSQ
jgi:hypothetical protein